MRVCVCVCVRVCVYVCVHELEIIQTQCARNFTLQFSGQLFDDFPQSVDLRVGLIKIVQTFLDADLQVQVATRDVNRFRGRRVPIIIRLKD